MTRTQSIGASLAVCGVLTLAACAKQSQPGQQSRAAAETSGEISQVEVLNAKVDEVDLKQRTIAMKDESGRPFVVDVGDNVSLDRIHRDDTVQVKYQESVAFALKEPGEESSGAAVEQSTRRIPDGVQFARQIDATVEIVSVTPDGSEATFKVPEGVTRKVFIDDAANQRKISHLKPGDAVAVTYTEKLALALED